MPRGRIPKVWFRKSTGTYYTTLDGRQIRLGTSRRAAFHEFARLTVGRDVSDRQPVRMTVQFVADRWIETCRESVKPSTFAYYYYYAGLFCQVCGTVLVRDLKPFHVNQWVKSRKSKTGKPLSRSTVRQSLTVVKTMTRWARREGYIMIDPIEGISVPEMARREPITLQDAETLMAGSTEVIRDALRVLLMTGMRPGEACSMTCENTDLDAGKAIVMGKTGHRTIYLPRHAIEFLEALLGERVSGPVLLNQIGTGLKRHSLEQNVKRARRRLGLGEHVKPHCFRGLFSTEALRNGVDAAMVSRLLGHADPSMLMRHYAAPDDDMMRDAVNRATQGRTSGTAPRKRRDLP